MLCPASNKKAADHCERESWGLPHGLGSIIFKESQSKPACLFCEKVQKAKGWKDKSSNEWEADREQKGKEQSDKKHIGEGSLLA